MNNSVNASHNADDPVITCENNSIIFADREGDFLVSTDDEVLSFESLNNARKYYDKLIVDKQLWDYSYTNEYLLFSSF